MEDTLFFRHNLELALNEVGADPTPRAFSLSRFHQEMRIRLARQPDALLGTSTHDTKRGEDARARLYNADGSARTVGRKSGALAADEPVRKCASLTTGTRVRTPLIPG